MKLYDRDYCTLTSEELADWEEVKRREVVSSSGTMEFRRPLVREYPKAARHFRSLFPNNYLDPFDLEHTDPLQRQLDAFRSLLDEEKCTERAILSFIREQKAYFIVAGLLKPYFHFGHHEAHLFIEFQLGNSFKADYLLAGKSSGGWNLVFVELEAPRGDIVLANGDLGAAFRKGLAQVGEWDAWLDARFASLSETFYKLVRPGTTLPQELCVLDKTRLHYVVVAGRRADFSERTYRVRRKRARESVELILHYDNLLDAAASVIGNVTY